MAITIRFRGEPNRPPLTFGPDQVRITFGRGADCDVVFPPHADAVGRAVHCALLRRDGSWVVEVTPGYSVRLAGRQVDDSAPLEGSADLEVGPNGPEVVIDLASDQAMPPTRKQASEAGTRTLLERLRTKTGRRLTAIAAAAGIAVLALAVYVECVRQETQELSAKQVEAVARVENKVEGIDERVAALGADLKDKLREAERSVYLVAARSTEDPKEKIGMGTAWVVADGILATNAHVAEGAEEILEEGYEIVVLSSEVPFEAADRPQDSVVESISFHPGYQAFPQIWDEHRPVVSGANEIIDLEGDLGVCDIALLHVTSSSRLAPPLSIASAETLHAIGAGDVVGFVGYPMESIVQGSRMTEQPSPVHQIGHVTGVSDVFLMKSLGEANIIQFSMAASGGASGSPILNVAGEVIGLVSAGNFVPGPYGDRIATGVGVNYGQRADLVTELLSGKVEEAQERRSEQWRAQIRRFPSFAEEVGKLGQSMLAEALRSWTANEELSETIEVQRSSHMTEEQPDGPGLTRIDLQLEAGPHLLMAVSPTGDDIDLLAFDLATDQSLGEDRWEDGFPWITIELEEPTTVAVLVIGMPDWAFDFHAYRGVREPAKNSDG